MSTNETLMKADMTLAELTSNGGLMPPEESTSFIRKLIISPTLLKQIRVVEMVANERKVNKIGFGKRILRKAVSATALTAAQRSKATTEQITLTNKEVIAEVRLPYDVVESNIERARVAGNNPSNQAQMGGIKDTLITLIAERAALDLEELGILGDPDYSSSLSDPDEATMEEDYLRLFKGYLRLAADSGHTVDLANEPVSKTTFKKGKKAVPKQYLRNVATMKHFVSMDNETEYSDQIMNRATPLGDQALQGAVPLFAHGSRVEGVALMPDAKGLYVQPLNLLMGIQRQMSMEFDKDISARVYIIVLTARVAFQVEEADAMVLYTNIGMSAA